MWVYVCAYVCEYVCVCAFVSTLCSEAQKTPSQVSSLLPDCRS